MKSLVDLVSEWQEQEKAWQLEGTTGVKNLCRLVHALGYQDRMRFGQFEKGCYGDLIEFLKDNPGAIKAIIGWIEDQNEEEWKESIESELFEEGSCCDEE